MATIEVESRVLGARRENVLRNVFFDPGVERLTIRAILLRAVEEQVRDLNARQELSRNEALRQLARQYQTEEEILALREEKGRAAYPDRERKARPIDLERAQKHALDAVKAGRCVVFVGDRQAESLDEEVEVGGATKVQFLRILPLRGGT